MFHVELIHDGWTRRSIGAKGVVLRRHPEHIARCIRAIHQRWDDEADITIQPQKSKIVQLRKRMDKSA